MRLKFVKPHKSIIASVTNQEIADFIVLSGLNGTGKSHLLEAIANGAITVDDTMPGTPNRAAGRHGSPIPPQPIRLFTLGQLAVAAEQGAQGAVSNRGRGVGVTAYGDRGLGTYQRIQNIVQQLTTTQISPSPGSDEFEEELARRIQNGGFLSPGTMREMLVAVGKPLSAFTKDDCRKYAPLLGVVRDPFALTLSELFLSYYTRCEENSNAQWRKEKGKPGGDTALTDEEFAAQYGPAPWDLLNEALSLTGLKYQVNHPEDIEGDSPYEVWLTHNETGVRIRTSELSSGERALMAIAMSLYTGSSLGDSIQLPQVLLLDESDASLHPSMLRILLRVVEDIFCVRHGVKVILTTHSPTTVALAPEESLYVMFRDDAPRIRGVVSRDEALRGLLVGLPTLSVRNENRRQVFVESDDDEGCYQALFRLLSDKLTTPFSLEFIASGRRGAGSDVAVKDLVQKLRSSGNEVQGILDRDQRSGAPEGIVFMERRRTLENLVLDPLLIGLLLLREGFASPKDVIGESLRHFQVEAQHAQAICNYVVRRLREDGYDEENVSVSYVGGFELSMPKFCLDMDGHDLEKRYRTCFPQLERYRNGLKAKVIDTALADVPNFAPLDIVELFQRLSSRT